MNSQTESLNKNNNLYKDSTLLKRYWVYIKPYKYKFIFSITLIPFVSILDVLSPYLIMHAIDSNLTHKNLVENANSTIEKYLNINISFLDNFYAYGLDGLTTTTIILVVVMFLRTILNSLQTYLLQYSGQHSVGLLREDIYKHVSSQSVSFFDKNPAGALLTRSTSDVESVGETLAFGAINILNDVLNLSFTLIFMLMLSVKLTLLSFCIGPLLVILINFFRKELKKAFVESRKTLSDVNAFLQEYISGIRIVQSFNQEKRAYDDFVTKSKKYLDTANIYNVYDASLYAVMDGMASLCIAALLWFGTYSFHKNTIDASLSLGLFVAFIEYIQRVFGPIKELSGRFAILQQAFASLERIFKLIDVNTKISSGKESKNSVLGKISFKNISFKYGENTPTVIDDISFEVLPGEVVALVGRTGSGKSTIGKILSRMYDSYSGSIYFEELELRNWDTNLLRSNIGYVQQDVILFEGSIAFNISLGNEKITKEKIKEAIKLVQLDDFVESLPEKYDFIIKSRGSNLSAGQIQLISFARVIAKDPAVIILDEATASVDSKTEDAIQKAIEFLFSTKTVIVIAHRLSTIQSADKIIVMDQGKIVEFGTHTSLLSQNGHYARLYQNGFSEN